MDRARDLEGGDVHVPDAIHVQVQAQGVAADHEGDDSAADAPGAAGLADAQHRTAEHEGHGDAVDDAQREVVDRGEPQVGQRRGDLGGGGVELSDARVRGGQRVDREDRDGDDNHGRKHADGLHDPVKVKEGSQNDKHRAQGTAHPRGQTKLLLEVRARAREHHKSHRETREDEHDVDNTTQRRVGDAFEDLVVVARSVVGAELERDHAEDDVEDAQDRDADQALRAKGQEVLEQVLATRQARADDDSHVGEGDREVLLGHRVLPMTNVRRGRGLVPR